MSALAHEGALTTASRDPVATAAHTLELTVWDVPPVTAAGERVVFMAGVRCSDGCDLGGRALSVVDQNGACLGVAKLGHDVWPSTEALYFAAVEATAPLEAGSHPWVAKMAGWEAEPSHAGAAFPLMVRVVPAPDCDVTVSVLEREAKTPIAGARVVMHPYRAVTNDKGIASLKIARGQYDMLVSCSRYLPVCISVDVSADMSATAVLDADQPDEYPA